MRKKLRQPTIPTIEQTQTSLVCLVLYTECTVCTYVQHPLTSSRTQHLSPLTPHPSFVLPHPSALSLHIFSLIPIDKLYTQIGNVNRLHNRIEPFAALF